DEASSREVSAMLQKLPEAEQAALVDSLHRVESLLSGKPSAECTLRPHRPGDMGWVVLRHGELYWQEYAWDERFEGLVADITARFVKDFDAKRERCWIAERESERLGCVFLVKGSEEGEARLRLLLVEPSARGLGLGKRLVEECVAFARSAGYRKIGLWTNSVLDAARHIYRQQGFKMMREEKHHSFGQDLVGETWELEL
ncbi:MAG TPA: GNAT family N-acetyltransferase, partial [Terriglobales bacterium]|nr:GNAT family N-acetyltransferase [Terriglobales bacterium]